MILRQPLELTETLGRYDIFVNVAGGGLSGQADAIRHGVTRALMKINAVVPSGAQEGRLRHA